MTIVVGNGLIAREIRRNLPNERLDNVVFIASGVSNSSCVDQAEFLKEKRLIEHYYYGLNEGQRLIYFSTTSVFFYPMGVSPYVEHKRAIESFLSGNNACLIVRLPQVLGSGGNTQNLCNWIFNSIVGQRPMTIFRGISRNILDVKDVVYLLFAYLEQSKFVGGNITISNPNPILVTALVSIFENILGLKAECRLVSGSYNYFDVNNIALREEFSGVSTFDVGYLDRIVAYYYQFDSKS